jgi:hypothetical protein
VSELGSVGNPDSQSNVGIKFEFYNHRYWWGEGAEEGGGGCNISFLCIHSPGLDSGHISNQWAS